MNQNKTTKATAATKTVDLGNNETATIGVAANPDGTFTALTFTRSRTFKTALRAWMWFNAATHCAYR